MLQTAGGGSMLSVVLLDGFNQSTTYIHTPISLLQALVFRIVNV